jgi:hypothetical protein
MLVIPEKDARSQTLFGNAFVDALRPVNTNQREKFSNITIAFPDCVKYKSLLN